MAFDRVVSRAGPYNVCSKDVQVVEDAETVEQLPDESKDRDGVDQCAAIVAPHPLGDLAFPPSVQRHGSLCRVMSYPTLS